jgi:hypothetical protein
VNQGRTARVSTGGQSLLDGVEERLDVLSRAGGGVRVVRRGGAGGPRSTVLAAERAGVLLRLGRWSVPFLERKIEAKVSTRILRSEREKRSTYEGEVLLLFSFALVRVQVRNVNRHRARSTLADPVVQRSRGRLDRLVKRDLGVRLLGRLLAQTIVLRSRAGVEETGEGEEGGRPSAVGGLLGACTERRRMSDGLKQIKHLKVSIVPQKGERWQRRTSLTTGDSLVASPVLNEMLFDRPCLRLPSRPLVCFGRWTSATLSISD